MRSLFSLPALLLIIIMTGCSGIIDNQALKNNSASHQKEEISDHSIFENNELSIGFNNVKIICENNHLKDGSTCKQPALLIDNERYPLPTEYSEGATLRLGDFNHDNNVDLFIVNDLGGGTNAYGTEGYLYSFDNNVPNEIFASNYENPIDYIGQNISFEINKYNKDNYNFVVKKKDKVIGTTNISQEKLYTDEIPSKDDVGYGNILVYNVSYGKIVARVGLSLFITNYAGDLTLTYDYIDNKFKIIDVQYDYKGNE